MLDAADDALDVIVVRRILPNETHGLSLGARDEDPLRNQRVRVRVEPRAIGEALDLEHAARLRGHDADLVGAVSLPARDRGRGA